MRQYLAVATTVAGCAFASALQGQSMLLNKPITLFHPETSSASVVVASKPPAKKAELGHGIDRWLDLNFLNYGLRYRSTFTDGGAHVFSQGQQKLVANGKFKFDEQGKYGIGFHASSGRYFNWAYADFIGGGEHQFITLAEAKLPPSLFALWRADPLPPGSSTPVAARCTSARPSLPPSRSRASRPSSAASPLITA